MNALKKIAIYFSSRDFKIKFLISLLAVLLFAKTNAQKSQVAIETKNEVLIFVGEGTTIFSEDVHFNEKIAKANSEAKEKTKTVKNRSVKVNKSAISKSLVKCKKPVYKANKAKNINFENSKSNQYFTFNVKLNNKSSISSQNPSVKKEINNHRYYSINISIFVHQEKIYFVEHYNSKIFESHFFSRPPPAFFT